MILFSFNDNEQHMKMLNMFVYSKVCKDTCIIEYTEAVPPDNHLQKVFLKYKDQQTMLKDYKKLHNAVTKFYKEQKDGEGGAVAIGFNRESHEGDFEDDEE